MRKLLTILASFLSLNANNANELYKKAIEFESKGDSKNALIYYKMAAQKALENEQTRTDHISNLDKNQNLQKDSMHSIWQQTTQTTNLKYSQNNRIIKAENNKENNYNIFHLEPYKVNYLLPITYSSISNSDRKHTETKFQLSLKKAMFDNLFGLDETFYLGYTQISWWQIAKESSPFRESNYQPEIFVDFPFKFDNFETLKSAQIGILHDSNGKSGKDSRSWNRVYLRSVFEYGNFSLAPRVWYRIKDNKDDNPDITNYKGNADIEISYNLNNMRFIATIANNLHFDKTNKGFFQFDFLFPIFNSGFYGYLQYFNGYAQSLIDYDKHESRVGAGFVFFIR
ncbi:phospholipase A [Campylobacter fetus subsp. venerealis]|uniref:phospholipase A n=1 Tax=Campylobacter fetus TaxID=196 RepID=UPI0008187FC4|nr:phospholipase A [Campylobacter fetus]MBK3498277.1 phospholipase A [Campylobacter fetus subsp. venerealis]MBK3502222.1 phospholipase A [Campylobacter fetus subsp. venerealis]OCS16402.1 phospholipase [Campylobacter fetus subsp. venerealis]